MFPISSDSTAAWITGGNLKYYYLMVYCGQHVLFIMGLYTYFPLLKMRKWTAFIIKYSINDSKYPKMIFLELYEWYNYVSMRALGQTRRQLLTSSTHDLWGLGSLVLSWCETTSLLKTKRSIAALNHLIDSLWLTFCYVHWKPENKTLHVMCCC